MGDQIIGWRILTEPMGDYHGGPAEILDRGDDDAAPEIVLNVRNDTGEPMGIFEYEDVQILQKTEPRKFEPEACNGCHYLGHAHGNDLYYHDSHRETTLIARFGSDGDYCSGLVFWSTGGAIHECLLRALSVAEFRRHIVERAERLESPARQKKFKEILDTVAVTQ